MQVKALVRQREGTASDAIPPAVEIVVGDIGDIDACKRAVQGVDKVIPEDTCACAQLPWPILGTIGLEWQLLFVSLCMY